MIYGCFSTDDFSELEVVFERSDTLNCDSIVHKPSINWIVPDTAFLFLELIETVDREDFKGGRINSQSAYRFDPDTDTLGLRFPLEMDPVVIIGLTNDIEHIMNIGWGLYVMDTIPFTQYEGFLPSIHNIRESGRVDISYDEVCFSLEPGEEWYQDFIRYDTLDNEVRKLRIESRFLHHGVIPKSKIKM